MARFARIKSGVLKELIERNSQPADQPHKSVIFLPCPVVAPPVYNAKQQKLIGPDYVINPTEVTETWTLVDLTTQEKRTAKSNSVAEMDSTIYQPVLKEFVRLENELTLLKMKINAIIDATSISGTVSKYTGKETESPTQSQVKQIIEDLL